jgi:hypothetical protein
VTLPKTSASYASVVFRSTRCIATLYGADVLADCGAARLAHTLVHILAATSVHTSAHLAALAHSSLGDT